MDDLQRAWAVIEQHHGLFDLDGDVTRSAMHLGLQVEDGWFGLVDRMCDELQPLAPVGFRIVCVKQDMGTLRVVYRGGTDQVDAVIEAVELGAASICELCGSAGTLGEVGGWWSVRCGGCLRTS